MALTWVLNLVAGQNLSQTRYALSTNALKIGNAEKCATTKVPLLRDWEEVERQSFDWRSCDRPLLTEEQTI
jgi:hypothetical protein